MENELPSWADAELTSALPHLAAASETQTVEFKREFPKHAGDLAKEIAAFATSNAGMILLGVEDSGEIIGIPEGGKDVVRRGIRERLEGIFNLVRPTITPGIRFAVFEDKVVAAITVPKGAQPIYYASSIPYHRLLTAARPMAPDDVIEAVVSWSTAYGQTSPEAEFLGGLAPFWAQVDLMISERKLRQLNPWAENLRWTAGHQADQARRFAASVPHEIEALAEPLEKLALELEVIAQERPMLSGPSLEVLGAIQDAAQIVDEVRAKYLGPGRFNAKVAADQRAVVVSEAKLLRGLIERIDADSSGSIYQAAQSEASERGEALFYVASIGAGVGDAAAGAELREIAAALRAIEKMPVYMDGGKSLLKIFGAARDADRRLQQWLHAGRRDGAAEPAGMTDAR